MSLCASAKNPSREVFSKIVSLRMGRRLGPWVRSGRAKISTATTRGPRKAITLTRGSRRPRLARAPRRRRMRDRSVCMTPIEVVIDGTNFGGKTPLVARLLELLAARGWSAGSASIYREGEVYDRWDDDPVGAAATLVGRMQTHRE